MKGDGKLSHGSEATFRKVVAPLRRIELTKISTLNEIIGNSAHVYVNDLIRYSLETHSREILIFNAKNML